MTMLSFAVLMGEVPKHLVTMSGEELRQLSEQVARARYGEDILIFTLIVASILFLIKRVW